MTDKQIKSTILKYNWNVERRVEDIRASVELELSCELWVEGKVKWIWNVESKWGREAAGRFEDITGNLRANIDVSIYRWVVYYLHATRHVNYIGKKSF